MCRESCHQNGISFGPVNIDKIKEASIQGRAVFYLPKTVRVNQEKYLHSMEDVLPEIVAVLSLAALIGLFIYKTVFSNNHIDTKPSSRRKLPATSSSASTKTSTSSFRIGEKKKRNSTYYLFNRKWT